MYASSAQLMFCAFVIEQCRSDWFCQDNTEESNKLTSKLVSGLYSFTAIFFWC